MNILWKFIVWFCYLYLNMKVVPLCFLFIETNGVAVAVSCTNSCLLVVVQGCWCKDIIYGHQTADRSLSKLAMFAAA